MKKSDNFDENIHNVNFKSALEEKTVDSNCLIQINGREVESLNGEYNFTVDPYESLLRGKWYKGIKENPENHMEIPLDYNFDLYPTMSVPSSWNLKKKELFYYNDTGLYHRTFKYENRGEDKVFLHLEGAFYRCYVFLNNEYVALHDGGSTPFSVDVTSFIKEGENTLLFAVDASRQSYRLPMENTDWFNFGGLYRDVYLVRTPKVFIKDYFVSLVPDGNLNKIKTEITLSEKIDGEVELSIEELDFKETIKIKNGLGIVESKVDLELWSPENPKLYEVKITLDENESVTDKIGFREIKVNGLSVTLNGEDIYLKGVSLHEDHFELGKTTNDDVIRQSIKDLKEMNGNFFRLAHYPHTRRFAQIADEEGLLLWEEIPVYWAIDFSNPITIADARNQMSELIKRDRNRASVIIWSVGNENPDTQERLDFMSGLAKLSHELDSTRLVSAACLVNRAKMKLEDRLMDYLDIIGNNEYYGWYEPDFTDLLTILNNTDLKKPVIITEFGAGAKAGNHGTKETLWTEEFQEELYKKQFETIKKCPFIRGTTPWIFVDFRAVRRLNKYQEGFNRKGLIAEDRKTKKKAYYVTQKHYGSF
jgi:beta-glucuronidase